MENLMKNQMIATFATLILSFSALNAANLTVQFEGTLTQSTWQDLKKGSNFKGELVVNQELQSALDTNSISSVLRLLLKDPSQFKLKIGDQLIQSNKTPRMLLEVINNHGERKSDHFLIRSYQNLLNDKDLGSQVHVSLQLDSKKGTALSTREIPDNIELSQWSQDYGLTISHRPKGKRGEHKGTEAFARGKINKIIIKKGEQETFLNLAQKERGEKIESPQPVKSFTLINWATNALDRLFSSVAGWLHLAK